MKHPSARAREIGEEPGMLPLAWQGSVFQRGDQTLPQSAASAGSCIWMHLTWSIDQPPSLTLAARLGGGRRGSVLVMQQVWMQRWAVGAVAVPASASASCWRSSAARVNSAAVVVERLGRNCPMWKFWVTAGAMESGRLGIWTTVGHRRRWAAVWAGGLVGHSSSVALTMRLVPG
ncbi:hypothetical protein IQ07DRAFT_409099 [Pyrenochaeta sp. DS3sAY3a]|nr:hypothetical protein IQ07DRAFT_409099 [Pyrenochaeta sp. DS3sAY3a]